MSWIKTIERRDAQGSLAKTYDKVVKKRGKVSNIMKAQSLNAEAMDAHMDLYRAIMFDKSGLSREEREVIATAVSVANNCPYCIHHHGEALNFYWKDSLRVDRFIQNPALFEDLDERQRALVDFALLATGQPAAIDEPTIEALRGVGFDDEQILSLNLVTAYFNFVNRIALGLGVEFTPEEVAGYSY